MHRFCSYSLVDPHAHEGVVRTCDSDKCNQDADDLRYRHDPSDKVFCSQDCLVDYLIDIGEVKLEAS
jgi:hypothetical protein